MNSCSLHVYQSVKKASYNEPPMGVCVCILLCIIAVGRCESFECHIIKLMAMQAQKLHFKCFLDKELLNWLQIVCVCMQCVVHSSMHTKAE